MCNLFTFFLLRRLVSFCFPSVCPEGGASDRIQGHYREGVPAQGHRQQARSQPLHQTH